MRKLCECGCGQPTSLIKITNNKMKRKKGEYARFIKGHWAKTQKKRHPQERFWKFVQKTDKCWLWTGHKNGDGYGTFFSTKHDKAHRFSYEISFGKIPDGMYVLHKCDNPSCVRPDHLGLGTQKDNMEDMRIRGRDGYKLMQADVDMIREMYRSKCFTQEELALRFGTSQPNISNVIHKTWKRRY